MTDNALQNNGFEEIPKEEFAYAHSDEKISDQNFEGIPQGFFKDALYRFVRNKASAIAFAIICILTILAAVGPSISRWTYREQNPDRTNMPPRVKLLEDVGLLNGNTIITNRRLDGIHDVEKYPEGSVIRIFNEREIRNVKVVDVEVDYYRYVGADEEYYWFGTDYLGRDLWSRLWRGTRLSLLVAVVAVAANILIGIVYGAIAGYYGGKLDMVMMRFCEVIFALPQVVVVTMFIMLFGTGIQSLILALVIRGWVPTAQMVRAQFLRFRGREYVLAARTLGIPDVVLIFRHILPNAIGPIITRAMIAIPGAIFTESFLAFIGLGLPAPEPSIGVLLSEGQKVLLQYPFQTLFPALLISTLMIAFNILSNGLRDAFDPTQRGQE